MRLARAIPSLAVAVALLAGCGISSGPVHVDGRRVDPGQQGVDSGQQFNFSRPENADAKELVQRFLLAAADDDSARDKTLQGYLSRDEFWVGSKEGINIIRVIDGFRLTFQPDGSTEVKVGVQYVGRFHPGKGWVVPSNRDNEELSFIVRRRGEEGLFISRPPQEYLLLESALIDYYEPRPLYFYEASGTRLVPDLRYVPRRLPEEGRASLLVKWLYDEPSPWLASGVRKPPDATQPTAGKQVTKDEDGMLVVDLATQPTEEQTAPLITQLAETLAQALRLQVQGQHLSDSARPTPTVTQPRRYGIVDGVVRRLKASRPVDNSPIPLPDEVNRGVSKVLFDRGEDNAVLVYGGDGENKRISIWRKGIAPLDVALTARQVQQPLWLDAVSFLILADRKLYVVGLDGRVTPVSGAEGVTAVSLGAERVRLALVQNGRLGVTVLNRAHGSASVDAIQFLQTPFGNQVQNVAFSNRDELTIAGSDGSQVTMVSVNVDGARLDRYLGEVYSTAVKVSHLVAWPSGAGSHVLFEIQGLGSYEALRTNWVPQEAVADAPASPGTAAPAKVSAPSLGG